MLAPHRWPQSAATGGPGQLRTRGRAAGEAGQRQRSESACDQYCRHQAGLAGGTRTQHPSTGHHTNSVDCDSAWPPNIYLPLSPQYTLPTHNHSSALAPQSRSLTRSSILIRFHGMKKRILKKIHYHEKVDVLFITCLSSGDDDPPRGLIDWIDRALANCQQVEV